MNKRLIYVPLEPYAERYTALMSSVGGWAETHFKNYGIEFIRIDGPETSGRIKSGVVLDAVGRNKFALAQVQKLIDLIDSGIIGWERDIIYFEDFWHPGVEALFYIRAMNKMSFKIGTFIHAQTFDEYDFCAAPEMSYWMRSIEEGYSLGYDYIFTCSDILKGRILEALRYDLHNRKSNIYKSGLPYNSVRLMEQLKEKYSYHEEFTKMPHILFSSRFDAEKDPHFFLDVVEANPDLTFLLVNPRAGRPISNDNGVVDRLNSTEIKNLKIIDTSNKAQYYSVLAHAKVQFNCALQDWVSWTLLEAITFKCNPVYPNWRDFPYELPEEYIYEQRNLTSASVLIRKMLEKPFEEEILNPIVQRHDNSWKEYLTTMGFNVETEIKEYETPYSNNCKL